MSEEVASTYGETDEKAIACKVALKRRDQNILMAPALDLSGLYGSQFVSINPVHNLNEESNTDE